MWPETLLHGLPFRHGEGGDAAATLLLLGIGVAGAAAAGLWVARRLALEPPSFLASSAFSIGALLFLQFDLLKESASLGQGLLNTPQVPLGLVGAFVLAAIGIPVLTRNGSDGSRVAWWWALGISTHGAAEGWIVGTEATDVAPLGAPLGAVSFLLHKALEAFTIRFVAGDALPARFDVGFVGLLAGAAVGGGLLGLWWGPSLLVLVLFAAGAGASAYAVLRLAQQVRPTTLSAAMVALGVVAVYAAGLLHEL